MINFDIPLPLVIQLLIATVLPVLVGIVTKRSMASGAKAVLLLVLGIVSSGLTELLSSINSNTPFGLGVWLIGAIATFVIGVAVHYGFWKPTGVAEGAGNIVNKDAMHYESGVEGDYDDVDDDGYTVTK